MNIISKYIIVLGLFLIIFGLFFNFFYDKFSWIGKLPGDIIINKKHVKIYFPVTSMIILSIILSIIINQLDR